ncbi:hypothetical protein V6N13_005330 [Hibiscus sabdariffa]|uniref:Uncharacterized protein n=1 Tax=Hibiscus sabdariffa TaxID=183260 RepID=A0ABR2ER30_9ROSI
MVREDTCLVSYVIGKPIQALIKPLPRGCTGALDVPEKTTVEATQCDAVEGTEGRAYRLFRQHSLRSEDPACSRIRATLHLRAHPENNSKLVDSENSAKLHHEQKTNSLIILVSM